MASTAQITFIVACDCHRSVRAIFGPGNKRRHSLPPTEPLRSSNQKAFDLVRTFSPQQFRRAFEGVTVAEDTDQ